MPKTKERRQTPWDKFQTYLDKGWTDAEIAQKFGYVSDDKADPFKPFRAQKSLGVKNGKLKPNSSWHRRAAANGTAAKPKKQAAAKKTKKAAPKTSPKAAPKVKTTKSKPVTSTKGFTNQVPPFAAASRDEAGQHVELTLSQGKVLIPNDQYLLVHGPIVDQIRGEASVMAVKEQAELAVPETVKQEVNESQAA